MSTEIKRIVGFYQDQITQYIEENKPAGAFDGSGRTLGATSVNNEDFFARLERQKQQKQEQQHEQQQQQKMPPKKLESFEQNLAPKQQQFAGKPHSIAEGESNIKKDLPAAGEGPKKALSPAAEAMKEQLLQFGYQEDEILKALSVVGPDSIDRLIDCITKIQNGENVESMPKPAARMTPEEMARRAEELKARAAQKREEEMKAAPKIAAKNELERRREVLELNELKKKTEEQKRLLEIEQAKKDKIREKQERERVRAKIAAQRNQRNEAAQPPSQTKTTPQATMATTHKASECTLKFNIPGEQDIILKFPPNTQFKMVDLQLKKDRPNIAHQRLSYASVFPPIAISSSQFNKTVEELGLMPRTMLNVQFC